MALGPHAVHVQTLDRYLHPSTGCDTVDLVFPAAKVTGQLDFVGFAHESLDSPGRGFGRGPCYFRIASSRFFSHPVQ